MDFNFGEFVTQRKIGFVGERGGDKYAFSGDLKLLKTMRNLKPLELAVSSTVRIGKGMLTGDLLGTAVKVGPKQYPRVHNIVKSCAATLGIPSPQVFIAGNIKEINAMTLGTDKESIIVIHALTVDLFTDDELKFVIG